MLSCAQAHAIYQLFTMRFPSSKLRAKEDATSERRATMFNQILQQIQRTSSRVPTPACLVDRFLDRVETWGRSVLPAKTGNRSAQP
jgi:hypothetical protein